MYAVAQASTTSHHTQYNITELSALLPPPCQLHPPRPLAPPTPPLRAGSSPPAGQGSACTSEGCWPSPHQRASPSGGCWHIGWPAQTAPLGGGEERRGEEEGRGEERRREGRRGGERGEGRGGGRRGEERRGEGRRGEGSREGRGEEEREERLVDSVLDPSTHCLPRADTSGTHLRLLTLTHDLSVTDHPILSPPLTLEVAELKVVECGGQHLINV